MIYPLSKSSRRPIADIPQHPQENIFDISCELSPPISRMKCQSLSVMDKENTLQCRRIKFLPTVLSAKLGEINIVIFLKNRPTDWLSDWLTK